MALEKNIVTKIIKYLKTVEKCHAMKIHGGMYSTAGISDILGIKNGKFFAIEVKAPDKRNNVTMLQNLFIDKIKNSGGLAFVACSVDEVKERIGGY